MLKSSEDYILGAENLVKTFGGLTAVSNFSFKLKKREILGLIGPNGAGKTTLFNLICGRYRPSSGNILFKDIDITDFKPHAICRLGISRTFQSSRPFPRMSTLQNVLVGHIFGKGFSLHTRPEDSDMARELLEIVGIAHKADTPAGQLTLSEQRRLDLARALATRPKLLLLDEVAAGFSPVLVKQAIELINRVRERGVSLLIIDHFLNLSLKVSDRLLALDHGEKIAEGPPHMVMRNRDVLQAYLGLRHQDEND